MFEPKVLGINELESDANVIEPLCSRCEDDESRKIGYCCACGARLKRAKAPARYSLTGDLATGFGLGCIVPACMLALSCIGLYAVGRWLIRSIWGP